ncbi:YggS family pyridoxal phosphate-dependent enzyme [Tepidibacillus sp. HK-1]|uniref:YggS family pyridoxal phosphate-dependent enzyme n=1 Tax=Tepidibacillus sp. HK-1 TaxID=1883407 RepID=UPI000853AC06|nr:YggS family pyridoxal phosphate-dependent enzyme [Tepidibacillus sp. HK-1]GBF11964.1 hypothetical protein HK1_02024 [Tepidibacillus sp. HK-1]
MQLKENVLNVKERIRFACERSGRDPKEIQLIAVTKYLDIDQTKQVLDFGLDHIAENKVQQVLKKYEVLKDQGTWHFIGHLQTNKVKQLLGKFDYLHSLDRFSLAQEINKRAKLQNLKVQAFIQVNISGETTKSGLAPEELLEFVEKVRLLDSIRIVGLMTMAPFVEEKEVIRPIFRRLRELRDEINDNGILGYTIHELSMGMSNDFEVAIEEGATFIRLGTVLFKGKV